MTSDAQCIVQMYVLYLFECVLRIPFPKLKKKVTLS